MPESDDDRVLAWVCAHAGPGRLLRDTHVMQALGMPEAAAQEALARLKRQGLIESHRVFTPGLEGYRHSVWGIAPTPAGLHLARQG